MTQFEAPFDLTSEYRRGEEMRLSVVETRLRDRFAGDPESLAYALEFLEDKRERLTEDPDRYYGNELAMEHFLHSITPAEETEQ